jgi:hypothetical protein
VPHREHYIPKHLGPKPSRPRRESTGTPLAARLRTSLVAAGAAVAATGLAVTTGIVTESSPIGDPAAAALASHKAKLNDSGNPAARSSAPDPRDRVVSRSEQRTTVDVQKARALNQRSGGQVTKHVNRKPPLSSADPRTIAKVLLARYGYDQSQFSCLDAIYTNESGWNVHAANPTSSAYGIPQALPGSKMATAGPNWENDPVTQIKWGLGYIKGRYGSPCGAWGFKQSHGWY